MILFETLNTFYADDDGDVFPRPTNTIRLCTGRDLKRISEAEQLPLGVEGLQPGDVAISASLADYSVAAEVPYLITGRKSKQGVIVALDLVQSNPERFATLELARSIYTVNSEALLTLGIDSLVNYLQKRFPRQSI